MLTLWGVWTMTAIPLDAVPDISDVQVIVSTEWPGRSPDLIEDQITYPTVTALLSAPNVKSVRGFTDFGISYVYVIFEDGTDIYWARSRVVEYLQGLRGRLPEGANPIIGPDATGVGWVFEYALVDDTGQHSLADLRSFQDWSLRYWLAAIPGVAEVASIGGFVTQYQVNIDPNKLAGYGLAIKDVVTAIRASNNDVEGRLLEFAGREYMVRGRGYLKSVDDIERVSLGASDAGTPIHVRDVAQVRLGPELRRGVAELDGRGEVVGGIIVMRFGENALKVIDRVKAKLREVQPSFPAGIRMVPTYDRSWLIGESIANLRHEMGLDQPVWRQFLDCWIKVDPDRPRDVDPIASRLAIEELQPEGKRAIKEGKIYADPIQFPDRIGRETVTQIVKYLNGEKPQPELLIPTKLYFKQDAQNDPTLK